MSQYELVKLLYQSEGPVKEDEIQSKFDLHPSTVRAHIKNCLKNGFIQEIENGFVIDDDMNKAKLERIRPKRIGEVD